MTALLFAVLAILPGAWIAGLLPLPGITVAVRVAIALLLSPLVLAIEYVALKSLGLSFEAIAAISWWTALPAGALIVRHALTTPRAPFPIRNFLPGAVMYGLLAVTALSPSIRDPKYAVYGRHAFMHSDTCYQFEKETVWPEEPQLADVRMAYPWFSHVHWAIIGRMCDLPPTIVDSASSLLYLAALCLCGYQTVRSVGGSQICAYISVILMTLGTNLAGRPLHLMKSALTGETGGYLTGDPRYSPLLIKFSAPNQMPLALALLAALILLSIQTAQRPTRSGLALIVLLALAVGLMYPPIFPAALLLPGMIAVAGLGCLPNFAGVSRRDARLFGAGLVVAVGIVWVYLQLICTSRARAAVELAGPIDMMRQAGITAVALGAVAIPAIRACRGRQPAQQLVLRMLGISMVVSAGLYVVLRMDGQNEYKFILCAAVLLGPLTGAGLDYFLSEHRKLAWGAAIAGLAVLIPMTLSRMDAYSPRFSSAPEVAESGYFLRLAANEAHAAWTNAVRTLTPVNTVVVARSYAAHVPAFTARAMFVAEEAEATTPGYGMLIERNLLRIRGYDESEYRDRVATVKALRDGRDVEAWRKAVGVLRSLGRPIAVVLEHEADQEVLRLWRSDSSVNVAFEDAHFTVLLFGGT